MILAPAPPGGLRDVNYDITIDPTFIGPQIVERGPFYESVLDTKMTAISTDACLIRQESSLVTVLHEER